MCTELKMRYFPAKPVLELSETVLHYMISLVPQGKLTRTEDIEKHLAKILNTEWVSFERDFVFNNDLMSDYINKGTVYQSVPMHRLISTRGLIQKRYTEELEKEGFVLEESRVSKYSMKVVDYKKYLFNFDEASIGVDTIWKVHKQGLSSVK